MESDEKRYKKYIVLLSEHFEKLKKNSILNKNLTQDEKDLVSILNSSLSPEIRLKRYQQIFFRTMSVRMNAPAQIQNPEPGTNNQEPRLRYPISSTYYPQQSTRKKTKDQNVQTKFTREDMLRLISKKKKEAGTSTTVDEFQDYFNEDQSANNFAARQTSADINTMFKTPTKNPRQRQIEEIFEARARGEDFDNQPRNMRDIYANDKDELDVEGETSRVMDEIRRLSTSSTPNLKNLQFRGLGDPDRQNITVYNPDTNEVLSIDKSDKQLELERLHKSENSQVPPKKATKRRAPISELENLHRSTLLKQFSPTKAKTRSGFVKRPSTNSKATEPPAAWTSYEEKFNK